MSSTAPFAADFADFAWEGYPRRGGGIGIRNKVLVMYTVECSSHIAEMIVRQADDPEVEVVGFRGCWDNAYAVRLLIALIRHPNVGAVLIVGNGCEHLQPKEFARIAADEGKPADYLLVQEGRGTRPAIAKGLAIVTRMREEIRKTPRCPMKVKDLVIGGECGGSDFTSGLAGNVVVGKIFDALVDLGGTAIFEEIMEAVGLRDYLMQRAETPKAARDIGASYDQMLEHCRDIRQFAIAPGNFQGGLSSIEEKSMGSVAKSGSRPIRGVIKVSMRPPSNGLWLQDSTPDSYHMGFGKSGINDNEGVLGLIASGCHIVLMVTGRGTLIGSPISPVLKVTGNSSLYERLGDDIDFNAGVCLSGEKSLDEAAAMLFRLIIDICRGRETKAEMLGHKEYCIPYKYQAPPCRCA